MARALITGCSTGIGRATAVELTKRGHEVVATARNPSVLDDLDVAVRLPLDVTSDASVAAAVVAAGDVDILVNNAGISVGGPIEHVPIDAAQTVFDTNVWGALRMVQAFAPGMRARERGWIVNVSSTMGRVVAPLAGIYAASKWSLEALSEAMENELRHFGIRVVVIEPGYIDTPMLTREETPVEPPYDELQRIWAAAVGQLQGDGGPPGPELVAAAIADALEEDEPNLRRPVGADAEMIVSLRDSMPYEEFITTVRGFLNIDW
jgi:NAD(P)-dependent dehydrogenase (short-subunit alcohol dehydrogenase family)